METTQTIQLVSRVQGSLSLVFTYDPASNGTRLLVREQREPLKVVRAFPLPHGAVLVHLHNISGGVLGGDQLNLTATVAEHASAQLTSTSATRVYRTRTGSPAARQTTTIHVASGGLLEYLPDPLIPFAGSRYHQETRITLADGAGLFWWETLAPGRTAHGEHFAYDELRMGLEISAPDRPLAIERFQLTPQRQRLSSTARLGPYSHSCSFYICRVGWEARRWSELERSLSQIAQDLSQPGTTIWAVSSLVAHGLVVRALSTQGRSLPPGLFAFWHAAKQAIYGQEAILPRKIY